MAGQWNHDLLARMVAPGIGDFTQAEIPDVSSLFKDGDFWIANHFLNSVFGPNFPGKWRIFAFNLIYRSQTCLKEYARARELTQQFLFKTKPGRPPVQAYFSALSAWEGSLLNFSIAVDIFKHMNNGAGVFASNDGSGFEKAYFLAGLSKHYALHLKNLGEVAEPQYLLPAPELEPHLIPVWLSNDGLNSSGKRITFSEYASAVTQLCQLADQLSNPGGFFEEAKKRRDASLNSGS